MDTELKKISCDPMCGFAVQSHEENEVVEMAKLHVEKVHPDANYTDDQIRSMMKKV